MLRGAGGGAVRGGVGQRAHHKGGCKFKAVVIVESRGRLLGGGVEGGGQSNETEERSQAPVTGPVDLELLPSFQVCGEEKHFSLNVVFSCSLEGTLWLCSVQRGTKE